MEKLKLWWAKTVAWFKGVEVDTSAKWEKAEDKLDAKYHDWKDTHKDDKIEETLDKVDAKYHDHKSGHTFVPEVDTKPMSGVNPAYQPKAVEPTPAVLSVLDVEPEPVVQRGSTVETLPGDEPQVASVSDYKTPKVKAPKAPKPVAKKKPAKKKKSL